MELTPMDKDTEFKTKSNNYLLTPDAKEAMEQTALDKDSESKTKSNNFLLTPDAKEAMELTPKDKDSESKTKPNNYLLTPDAKEAMELTPMDKDSEYKIKQNNYLLTPDAKEVMELTALDKDSESKTKSNNFLLTPDAENAMELTPKDKDSESKTKPNNYLLTPEAKHETPDHILQELGGFGKFQIIHCVAIQFMMVVLSWTMTSIPLFAYVPKWRCLSFENTTSSHFSEVTYTLGTNGSFNQTLGIYWNQQCYSESGERCTKFEFEEGVSTLVVKFGLVCDMAWVTATATSLMMAGTCVGSFTCGQLSDAIGRKKPIFFSMALYTLAQTIVYFSQSWIMYSTGFFFLGMGAGFYFSSYCVLQTEYVLSKWRAIVVGFPTWQIGSSLFALVAWQVPDWNTLSLIMAVMAFTNLFFWFIIPESFRWHISKDCFAEAEKTIALVARRNKKPQPDFEPLCKALAAIENQGRSKFSLVNMLRNPALRKLTLIMAVPWFCNVFISYGIGFGIKKLPASIFLNMFVFALTAIPAKVLSVYLQNRFGRRMAGICAFIVTGVGGLAVGIVQYIDTPARGTITNYCALVAAMGSNALWGPLQTISLEIYPTVVRSTGFGLLSLVGRFGAVVGPQFVYLEEFVPGIMYFTIAVTSLVSCLMLLQLPETKGSILLDKLSRDLEGKRVLERNL